MAQVNSKDKVALAKLVEAIRDNYNDIYPKIYHQWGVLSLKICDLHCQP
jgi:hypothetical protein